MSPMCNRCKHLRAAAAAIRDRVSALPPSPWVMYDGWGPTSDGLMAATCIASSETGERVIEPGDARDLYAKLEAFEHIAKLANPAAGLALADLLDALATDREDDPYLPKAFDDFALALASAYLGTEPEPEPVAP